MDKTLVVYMGASILIGSFIGSFGANVLAEHTVNVVYATLATILCYYDVCTETK